MKYRLVFDAAQEKLRVSADPVVAALTLALVIEVPTPQAAEVLLADATELLGKCHLELVEEP